MKNAFIGFTIECTWLGKEFLSFRISQQKPSRLKNKENKDEKVGHHIQELWTTVKSVAYM